MKAMNPLSDLPLLLVDLEMICHMNTPDDEYTAFTLDLPYCFGTEAAIVCRNVARLQRAPKRAGQSTGGRSHNIIKCGGVRFLRSCVYPIVLC
jgi:hypothetical protein